jgi:hypothetical protein
MTGVDILSSSEVVVDTIYHCRGVAFTILFVIFILSVIGGLFMAATFDNDLYILLGSCIGIAIGLLTGCKIDIANKEEIYQTQYKATISEEVSLVEFNEKYEIIDQEGKIYTIVEKES